MGCGDPATEAQCQELAQHIARLQLESRGIDSAEITRRLTQAESDPEYKKTMEGCVGKRITQARIDCVKNAKTPEEVKNQCAR